MPEINATNPSVVQRVAQTTRPGSPNTDNRTSETTEQTGPVSRDTVDVSVAARQRLAAESAPETDRAGAQGSADIAPQNALQARINALVGTNATRESSRAASSLARTVYGRSANPQPPATDPARQRANTDLSGHDLLPLVAVVIQVSEINPGWHVAILTNKVNSRWRKIAPVPLKYLTDK